MTHNYRVQRFSKSGLEKHWADTANAFRSQNRPWIDVFWDLMSEVSKVAMFLEQKKQLAENCSFLLLSKAVNHALAMFSMAQRGLCIDAAQASRNAVETLLLLQLLLLDESEDLFRKWSRGGTGRSDCRVRFSTDINRGLSTLKAARAHRSR